MTNAEQNELLRQLGQTSVCHIADARGPSLALDTQIRPLDPSFRICATAFTVLCPPNDNLTLHHALYMAVSGHVLIVSGSGSEETAFWGELMSISAQARGLGGTIIDGPARDPLEIAALKYPVFARSICPRRASKERYGSVGAPVKIGSLVVAPGDIVVADCNGILAFPPGLLADVVEQSKAVVRKEAELKDVLSSGQTYFELAGLSSLVPAGRDQIRGA
jgi:4-hydroxy-4-methyl-2-oxoglutarate aldolase